MVKSFSFTVTDTIHYIKVPPQYFTYITHEGYCENVCAVIISRLQMMKKTDEDEAYSLCQLSAVTQTVCVCNSKLVFG